MKPCQWYEASELIAEAEQLGFPATGSLQQARQLLGIVKPHVKKTKHGWLWWRLATEGEEIAVTAGNS